MNIIKATNALVMKEKNKKLILDIIRQSDISRVEISKKTGLTKAAITIIIEDLLREQAIVEAEAVSVCAVGRPPVLLSLNKNSKCAVGVCINKEEASVGVSQLSGNMLCECILPIAALEPRETIDLVAGRIEAQLRAADIPRESVLGIGIVPPCPIAAGCKTAINPLSFQKWRNIKLGQALHEKTGLPTYVETLPNCCAICEKYFGKAKNESNFLLILVKKNVGSGIVLNGKIYRGENEIGHTSIKYDGIPCECGNIGYLQKYASIEALLQGTEYSCWKEVVDREDLPLIEQEARYLSVAVVSAVNMFGIEKLIIAGDLAYKPDALIAFLERHTKNRSIYQRKLIIESTDICSASLCAASLAVYHYYN